MHYNIKHKYIIIPNWVLPTHYRGFGILDLKFDYGVHNILQIMNSRLLNNIKDINNIIILNTNKWIEKTNAPVLDSIDYETYKKYFSHEDWEVVKYFSIDTKFTWKKVVLEKCSNIFDI